ncbi:MAG TPA: SDR family oxidoreductase [Gemmatimonadaceae bacterium]|nr:SDR family oxidoreductase [Gemmatimonadaceae bacterium]
MSASAVATEFPVIAESDALWARARGLIPGGTQTYAKGPGQYVGGVAPKYLRRGRGARVWDVDGNEFLDLSMAVGPLVLGYAYAPVDDAIRRQLEDGITFSLMHPLEVEVAEQIRDLVPYAKSVRFSKTGADVTTAGIRVARAFTGRDKVLCCGYHGWHDWYIATTDRAGGIPESVRDLTFTFEYNDPASYLNAISDDVACVILEPMVFQEPAKGFLELLRAECTRHGALLVFDEMWTGFRLATGGAQERYGVTPDLVTFSKAVANGMPLSVLAGRADVMRLYERDLFFYTTFGGEALSLAAAQATLREISKHNVPEHLERVGGIMRDGYNAVATDLGIADRTACIGAGCRSLVTFTGIPDPLVHKTLLQQEMIRRGILWSGGHVVSYSHTDQDAAFVVDVYAEVLPLIADAIRTGDARRHLRGATVEPVFRRTGQFNTKPAVAVVEGKPAKTESNASAGLSRFSLADAVVLITGAGGLLGHEHALAVAEMGGTVVLVDLDDTSLASLADRCRSAGAKDVLSIAADVTSRADLDRTARATLDGFGRIDVLVNNAGLNDKVESPTLGVDEGRIENFPLETWRRMLDVNITGVFLPCQVFGGQMVRRGSGSIINVASMYALVGPDPSLYAKPDGTPGHSKAPSYAASKGAVVALTRQLAAHWGRDGIRVNALVPGGVKNGQPAHFIETYARRTPLGRMAAPDDYRGALVFLASNASSYMTGATLVVDGGFTAR